MPSRNETINHRLPSIAANSPHAAADDTCATEKLELENDIVISQLHETQELVFELSEHLRIYQAESARLQKRVSHLTKRLIERDPEFWEFESLSAEFHGVSSSGSHVITWHLKNAYIADRLHQSLAFETHSRNGYTGILFDSANCTEIRAFKENKNLQSLACFPVPGNLNNPNNAIIGSLGTSDWEAINALIPKVIGALRDGSLHDLPTQVVDNTETGLRELSNTLKNWPSGLRYDELKLTNTVNSPEFQAIDVELSNVSIKDRSLPKFTYRLSSVNTANNKAGQFPRLEFPEESRHCFDNWFIESDDDRGRRLELRFAMPNSMDLLVWSKLSNTDKLLIAATISKLPHKVSELARAHSTETNWDDWTSIANMVKDTLINAAKALPYKPT